MICHSAIGNRYKFLKRGAQKNMREQGHIFGKAKKKKKKNGAVFLGLLLRAVTIPQQVGKSRHEGGRGRRESPTWW